MLEGQDAVKAARQVIGATNPLEAAPGSIRGDFALEVGQNMVHGSDSDESAEREANLFFPKLVLASASPQRRAILAQLGVAVPRRARRRRRAHGRRDPRAVAAENARRKALAGDHGDALVLGADTVVAVDGDVLGKPRRRGPGASPTGAARRPRAQVVGGIALARGGAVVAEAVEVTEVVFRALEPAEVDWLRGARRVGGAGRRLRDPGRRRGARPEHRRATTSTSSGCRSRACSTCLACTAVCSRF